MDRVPWRRTSVNYLRHWWEVPLECGSMDALLERTFEAEHRHFWFRGFKRFVAPLIEEATTGRSKPKLLDAGCGTGANLPFLQHFGSTFGLELFWRGIQFGQSRGLSRLIQGSVTQMPFAFDCMSTKECGSSQTYGSTGGPLLSSMPPIIGHLLSS